MVRKREVREIEEWKTAINERNNRNKKKTRIQVKNMTKKGREKGEKD